MHNAIYLWLVLVIILLVTEVCTLGLTTIGFAVGAACALILSLFHVGFIIQLIVFFAVACVMLIFTRPFAVKYLNSRTSKTNAEAYVGRNVRVTEDINNLKDQGHVIVGGLEWMARSSDDTVTFRKDEIVTVAGIEGVKMIVEKKKEDNECR